MSCPIRSKHIEALLSEVIRTHDIDAVFLEDIQLRKNVQSFKKLAQLQGVLVNMCEKTNILYNLVAPTQWQNYCKARGRTTKEIKKIIVFLFSFGVGVIESMLEISEESS